MKVDDTDTFVSCFVVLLALLFEANRISRADCVHRVLRTTRMEV